MFGAQPPKYLIYNISQQYVGDQGPKLTIVPNYRPVNLPQAVSTDGIEMLLRGFGDIASSGRYLLPSDFISRGCDGSLVNTADGSSTGTCQGRLIQNIAFVNDRLFFGVDPSNPVKDITKAQLATAVAAVVAGTPVTWSSLYPGVTFPASLANAPVNVLSGPPGGGIPVAISLSSGVAVDAITPLTSAAISKIEITTTNWLGYFLLSSPPTNAVSRLSYDGLDILADGYELWHTFNAIIDVNNPNAPAVADFLCYVLDYKFDGAVYNLFPLSDAQKATEKGKLKCSSGGHGRA
ncbi:hypothetical protein HK101_004815 [Irineochytrium annulatum]|nr:hypothetical protein HK101_004815 [Irineochytrium annulatum]